MRKAMFPVAAVAVAFTLALAGCGNPTAGGAGEETSTAVEGIDGNVIQIAMSSPESGPGAVAAAYASGLRAYLDEVNGRGGVGGYTFNVTTFDLATNDVSSRSYVDLFASYRLTPAIELYGRVENLFNVAPPLTPNSIATPTVANSPFFDRRGTFFVLGGRIRL